MEPLGIKLIPTFMVMDTAAVQGSGFRVQGSGFRV
jgi:hypothetical protein